MAGSIERPLLVASYNVKCICSHSMQQQIVKNRILKNSKIITLPGGEPAFAVFGNEYCNMMHDQLTEELQRKERKDVHITLTAHPEFEHIRISLRSCNKTVDVS